MIEGETENSRVIGSIQYEWQPFFVMASSSLKVQSHYSVCIAYPNFNLSYGPA